MRPSHLRLISRTHDHEGVHRRQPPDQCLADPAKARHHAGAAKQRAPRPLHGALNRAFRRELRVHAQQRLVVRGIHRPFCAQQFLRRHAAAVQRHAARGQQLQHPFPRELRTRQPAILETARPGQHHRVGPCPRLRCVLLTADVSRLPVRPLRRVQRAQHARISAKGYQSHSHPLPAKVCARKPGHAAGCARSHFRTTRFPHFFKVQKAPSSRPEGAFMFRELTCPARWCSGRSGSHPRESPCGSRGTGAAPSQAPGPAPLPSSSGRSSA